MSNIVRSKVSIVLVMLSLAGCQTLGFGKKETAESVAEPTLEDTLTPVDSATPPEASDTPKKPEVKKPKV